VKAWAMLLALGVLVASPGSQAASNSRMALESFHTAAQQFLKQQDAEALETVNGALTLDPSNEPSQKLKEFIEAELKRQDQKDPNNAQQPKGEDSQEQQKESQQKSDSSKDESKKDSDSKSEGQTQPTPKPSPQPVREALATPSPGAGQRTPTPGSGGSASEPSGSVSPGTPTPAPGSASAMPSETPAASPSPGAALAASTPGADKKDDKRISDEQVKMLLQALTEDELSQLRTRPVKIYGEQQTDEDW
jgi:hypothetical protein